MADETPIHHLLRQFADTAQKTDGAVAACVILVFAFFGTGAIMVFFQTAGAAPSSSFRSTALEWDPRCFSISSAIPSGSGAFIVFTFFKASFSSFMLKGSVMEQSRSALNDDRMMFCFLSDLLGALSGNMGGVLFLAKVCKTFAALFSVISSLFASITVLLLEWLSLFSALVRFHRPVVSFVSIFSDAVFSCQLFLVACVLALMYCICAFLCASTFAFAGELSIFSLAGSNALCRLSSSGLQ